MRNEGSVKRKFTLIHGILIVGFLLIIVAIGVVGYFVMQPKPQEETKKGALVVDESNLDEIQEMFAEPVDDGLFEVNMNTVWYFQNGTSASRNAYLANGEANHLPLSFEIIVEEEVIYSSTVIPVGNKIKEIILDKELPKGQYAARCQYYLWNEDGTENSNFGVNLTLIIEE